jgi:hypothetical protein
MAQKQGNTKSKYHCMIKIQEIAKESIHKLGNLSIMTKTVSNT